MKLLLLLILFPCLTFSQAISKEKIRKLKSCTVRVTIDGSSSMGTGFFIDNRGSVVTCWHVIESAIVVTQTQIIFKPIYIETSNNVKLLYSIHDSLILSNRFRDSATANDFCVLVPSTTIATESLTLGSYQNVSEGDEIYTCGYPLGMGDQFVTKGMLSTKLVSTILIDSLHTSSRMEGLLDLTLNKGNSGGAVMRLNPQSGEDYVIGIADYVVGPAGNAANKMIAELEQSQKNGRIEFSGIDPTAIQIALAKFISNTSIGIGGCVSIDHFCRIFCNSN